MLISERVHGNVTICGIEVDLSAQEFASGNFDVQPFYNSNLSESNFQKVYTSSGSIAFQETSEESVAGIAYTQNVTMKFPSFDNKRSQRIDELQSLKFISLKLNDGQSLLLGRNDFFQNTKPRIAVQSNQKVTVVSMVTQSVFPIGFFGNTVPYGFSYQIPVSLLELI